MTFKQVLNKLNRRDTKFLPKNLTLTKLFLILFFGFTVVFSVKTLLAADKSQSLSKMFIDKQKAVNSDDATLENWSSELLGGQVMTGINIISGSIPESVLNGTATSSGTSWIPGGILGVTHNAIASLYNQPISGVEYIAQMKNDFLGKPAYADTGFQGLSPLIPIWKTFRNTAYVLFSLFFVAIGIMIMLRIKISPQATITIQSAIPKVITSLILVTFSYAIAGLLIDLSKIIEAFGISLFASSGQYAQNINVANILKDPQYFWRIWGLIPWGTVFILAGIVGVISGVVNVFSILSLDEPVKLLKGVIGGPKTLLLNGGKTAFIAAGIVLLLVLIFIVWQTVKLCFGLLKCYLTILISVILSPLEISLGAIPNMKIGFGSWFTNIFANIMVFPIVTIFLVMIEIIKNMITNTTGMWVPNGVSGFNFLAIGTPGGIVPMGISLGGILIAAKLPTLVPQVIFQLKPSEFGKAIGEGVKAPVNMGKQTAIQKTIDVTSQWGGNNSGASATPWTRAKGQVGSLVSNILRRTK